MRVAVSKFTSHGFSWPIKCRIFTSCPNLKSHKHDREQFCLTRSKTANSLFECRQIRVACRRAGVVDERQPPSNVFGGPVGEVQIQQALIAAIETALLDGERHQLGELIQAGPIHEHARIEAVWPADIRSGRQLFAIEQFVAVLQDLRDAVRKKHGRHT